MKKIFYFLTVILAVAIVSCDSDDSSNGGDTNDYDRTPLLTNIADHIIIPSFTDLNTELGLMVSAKNEFISNPNQSSLDNLRASWLTSYKVWQFVEMFNIGKAEEIQYGFQMNVYPVSVSDIENNISSESYDLTHPNNNDAVGFPTVDYMLYGVESSDQEIINKYSTNTDADKYKNYLSDIIDQMKSLTESVLNDWTSSYRDTFVASTSNSASSSTNKLVNDFIYYYEKSLRTNKVGIPAGVFSPTPLPEKVEALYKDNASKELSLDAINAVQDFFNGKHYNSFGNGEGLKSYLNAIGETGLSNSINEKLDNARQKVHLLEDSFYNQVMTDNTKMTVAFDALQEVVVLLKVNMLQAFGISVDYIDADGD